MKRKRKIILLISGILVPLIITGMLLPALRMSENSKRMISCTNHLCQLSMMLCMQDKNNENLFQLPYNKNLPGYAVIAEIHQTGPGFNCNHGAPNAKCSGGWQYLNLPNNILQKLYNEWAKKSTDKFMPVLWCGKETGQDYRMGICCIIDKNKPTWDRVKKVTKSDITLLNKCLKTINQSSISINIPDNIDWGKYIKEEHENKVAPLDQISAPRKSGK